MAVPRKGTKIYLPLKGGLGQGYQKPKKDQSHPTEYVLLTDIQSGQIVRPDPSYVASPGCAGGGDLTADTMSASLERCDFLLRKPCSSKAWLNISKIIIYVSQITARIVGSKIIYDIIIISCRLSGLHMMKRANRCSAEAE